MSRKPSVTREEFVSIWRSSFSLKEAARRAGLKMSTAKVRASELRKAGVDLPRFPGLFPRQVFHRGRNSTKGNGI